MASAAMASLAPPEDRMDVAATPDSTNDIEIDFELGDTEDQRNDDEHLLDIDEELEDGQEDNEVQNDIDEEMDGESPPPAEAQMDDAQDELMQEDPDANDEPTEDEQIDATENGFEHGPEDAIMNAMSTNATNDGNSPTLPIMVSYDGSDLRLFSLANEDGWVNDLNFYNISLNSLLGKIRSRMEAFVVRPKFLDESALTMEFPQLGLSLAEDDAQAYQTSVSDIVNLYLQLQYNDGRQLPDVLPLAMTIELCASFSRKFAATQRAAEDGAGLSQLPQVMNWDDTTDYVNEEYVQDPTEHHETGPNGTAEEAGDYPEEYYNERQGQGFEEYEGQEPSQQGDAAEQYEPEDHQNGGLGGELDDVGGEDAGEVEGLGTPEEATSTQYEDGEYGPGESETQLQQDEVRTPPPDTNDTPPVIATLPADVQADRGQGKAQGSTNSQEQNNLNSQHVVTGENEEGELLSDGEGAVDYEEGESEVQDGEFAAEEAEGAEGTLAVKASESLDEGGSEGQEGLIQQRGDAMVTPARDLAEHDEAALAGRSVDHTFDHRQTNGNEEQNNSGYNDADSETIERHRNSDNDFVDDEGDGEKGPNHEFFAEDDSKHAGTGAESSAVPQGDENQTASQSTTAVVEPSEDAEIAREVIDASTGHKPADTSQVALTNDGEYDPEEIAQRYAQQQAQDRNDSPAPPNLEPPYNEDEFEDDFDDDAQDESGGVATVEREKAAKDDENSPLQAVLEPQYDSETKCDFGDNQQRPETSNDATDIATRGDVDSSVVVNAEAPDVDGKASTLAAIETVEVPQNGQPQPEDSKAASLATTPPAPSNAEPKEESPEDDIVWDDLTPTEHLAQEAAKQQASEAAGVVLAKRQYEELDDLVFSDNDEPQPKKAKANSSVDGNAGT